MRAIPGLFVASYRIRRQLDSAAGRLGYSLRARPLSKRFWTPSAWEDEAALRAFVTADPHLATMTSLAPHMGPTRFVRWRVTGEEPPLRWPDALVRAEPA